MGLFSRHTYNIGGNAKQYEFGSTFCGETCKKCGKGTPGCTKQIGHSAMQGHLSNSNTTDDAGNKGCGHSWE